MTTLASKKIFRFILACSRLRDSRARGIEKARIIKKKTGGNWGEGEAFLFLFFPPRPHFRAPYTFASSPLSESLEQARFIEGDVTRDNSQRRFIAQHRVPMLEQCCSHSKQCRNNVATLCCAKNRRCESSRVTSPLWRT